jgi:archaellum biogenesis ATPase FlaH
MWDRERTTQEKVHDLNEARERLIRERDVCQMLVTEEEWIRAETPEALVEGLIYRKSLIQVPGGTKMGKTFLALQLTICLLLGIKFLGKITKRSRVLYLSLEMPTGEMRKRVHLICRDALGGVDEPVPGETPGFFFVGNEWEIDLDGDDGWEILKALISHTEAEVVIIDSLHKVLVSEDREQLKAVYNQLVRLAQKGPAIIVLDQMSRAVAIGRDPTPTAMASIETVYKGANANVILALQRVEDGRPPLYKLGVAGHYHTLSDPISLRWPVFDDGRIGYGWETIEEEVAYGVTRERLWQVFNRHADRNGGGRLQFASQTKLLEALIAEDLLEGKNDKKTGRLVPTSNGIAMRRIGAIRKAYVFEHGDEPPPGYSERPVWASPRRERIPIRYVWCGREDPGHDLFHDADASEAVS